MLGAVGESRAIRSVAQAGFHPAGERNGQIGLIKGSWVNRLAFFWLAYSGGINFNTERQA